MASAPSIAFSHVGIHVTDLRQMENFYTRFLGFTVTDRGPLAPPNAPALSSDQSVGGPC